MRIFQVWMANFSLWFRVAVAISLGFLGLLIAFALLGERALQDSTDKLFEERMAITQLVADQIDNLLGRAVFELQQANKVIDFDENRADFLQNAATWISSYEQVGLFSPGIVLLNSRGVILASEPSGLYEVGADLSAFSYIDNVMMSGEASIAEPFLHPVDEYPVTAVTVPLTQNGQVIGYLSGLINLNSESVMLPLSRAVFIGQTEHAILVDAEGRSIASTLELPYLSPGEHTVFYKDVMATGVPTIETVEFELDLHDEPEGHQHVMAFVPLQNTNWGVAVGGDAIGDTFTGVQQLRDGLIILGTLSLVSIWIITMLGTRKLVQPVQELTQAAHRIADGDLMVPLTATEGGEIGVLAVALNEMRNQMLQSITKLSKWNETLELRVAEQTDDLRHQQQLTQQLLQQVINAQESERGRIAYELHDEIGQMLTAVEMSLRYIAHAVPPEDEALNMRLTRSHNLIEKTMVDLRRIIAALRPTVLDQLGLVPALDWICDQVLLPLDIKVTFLPLNNEERLPEEIETILFRIAQEAVNNIARHSQATHVTIGLDWSDKKVTLHIKDNGIGFDLADFDTISMNGRGMGLAGMRERAALAGGQVDIISTGEGETAVIVIIPLTKIDA